MARKKRSFLSPSKTQERLKKQLYQKKGSKRRKKSTLLKNIKAFFAFLFPYFKVSAAIKNELSGIFFVLLTCIMVLSILDKAGSSGEYILENARLLFGDGIYCIPCIFGFIAWELFTHKESEDGKKKKKLEANHIVRLYLGSFLIIVFVLGIFHVFVPFEEMHEVASKGFYGGFIGFTVNFFLRPYFLETATFIICFLSALGAILFTFDLRVKDIFAYLQNILSFEASEKDLEAHIQKYRNNKSVITSKKILDTSKQTEKSSQDFVIRHNTVKSEEYEFPNLSLLDFEPFSIEKDKEEINYHKAIIQKTLQDFNIVVEMAEVNIGPTVTQYTFKPEAGTKLAKIIALQNDLSLALAAQIRIEAPIPGKSVVGIEIPNAKRASIRLRHILESKEFASIKSPLRLPLGRDIQGKSVVADLATMPHLLVAGATGAGKSVGINTFLISLLYQNSPNDLKLILIDPKRVELIPYNGIAHLLTPVITDATKTVSALRWAVAEMTNRYDMLANKGCRNITEYNSQNKDDRLPFIVIVIDELADLMMVASKEVETLICRLAQMARAVGMHLIVATQRPSVDVVTGLIKANIPARVSFTVSTSHDSKTILDRIGAEKLLGKGDMLYLPGNESNLYRIQGIYTSTKEAQDVIRHVKLANTDVTEKIDLNKTPDDRVSILDSPVSIPGLDDGGSQSDDELCNQAIEVIKETKKASASNLQRRLKIGYNRAARMIDMLEEQEVIGPANGSKPREIYIH